MVHCRACGKEIHESARVCPQCGFIMIIVGAFTDKAGNKLTEWV